MTDYTQTKLGIENSLRSTTKVRQLTPEQLGIPGTDDGDPWEVLVQKAEESKVDEKMGVAVRTEDGSVTAAQSLSQGQSHDVHALEFAIWKAFEKDGSPISEVSIAAQNPQEGPCGRCLQVLADYSGEDDTEIHVSGKDDSIRFNLDDLLQH